jgi:hypothetical protein
MALVAMSRNPGPGVSGCETSLVCARCSAPGTLFWSPAHAVCCMHAPLHPLPMKRTATRALYMLVLELSLHDGRRSEANTVEQARCVSTRRRSSTSPTGPIRTCEPFHRCHVYLFNRSAKSTRSAMYLLPLPEAVQLSCPCHSPLPLSHTQRTFLCTQGKIL